MTRPDGRLVAAVALGFCLTSACASRQALPSATAPPASASSRGPAGLTPAEATLAAAFDARIAAADGTALWAVRLERLDTRAVLVSRDADRLILPASNMKIVTLAAAATRLGWDYRFRTRLYAAGTRDAHVLRGDLVVVGGADPTLGRGDDPLATFRAWARQLRAQGLRRIEGDLVGDPSRFGEEWLGDSWSWDDLAAGYAAAYSGLTFHENAVRVRVTPAESPGSAATVTLSPLSPSIVVDADVATSEAVPTAAVRVTRELGSPVVRVTGTVPIGGATVERVVSVPDPPRAFLDALRTALAEEGIDIRGTTRVASRPDVDAGAPLIVHESAPLSEVAQRFMKVSQNLYGEILLRVVTASGSPAAPATSPAEARDVLQDVIGTLGVPVGTVQGRDGSGLSRRDFVTAGAVTTLLHAMAQPPHRHHFRTTLPVAGVDGTIGSRFKGSPCAGRLFAKTGTLSHVRALSGYVTSASGSEYVFSVIANNFLVPSREVDTIVEDALALVCAS